MKASPVVQRTLSPGLCESSRLAIELQQVRLADAGRAADEQRVVGLRGHLGDGQRGGVGEPVAVADHELVERELGVAERAAASRRGPPRGCGRCGAAGARRARPRRCATRRHARLGVVALDDELDGRVGPSTSVDAGLEHAPEAVAGSSGRRAAGASTTRRSPASSTRAQRLEPDAVGGLVDARGELGLDARPYVLELGAHGSVDPLLSERKCAELFEGGPARSPVRRLYPTALAALARLLAIGGKNQRRGRRGAILAAPARVRRSARGRAWPPSGAQRARRRPENRR